MKKRYFIMLLAIVTAVAYIDLIENCKEIDRVISSIIQPDNAYKNTLIVKDNPYFKTFFH